VRVQARSASTRPEHRSSLLPCGRKQRPACAAQAAAGISVQCLPQLKIPPHDSSSDPICSPHETTARPRARSIAMVRSWLLEGRSHRGVAITQSASGRSSVLSTTFPRAWWPAARALLRRPAVSCAGDPARPSAVQGAVISRASAASGPVSERSSLRNQMNRSTCDIRTPTMRGRSDLFARSPSSPPNPVFFRERRDFSRSGSIPIVLGRHGECFSKAEAVSVATANSPDAASHCWCEDDGFSERRAFGH